MFFPIINMKGESEAKAEALKNEIFSRSNTDELYMISGNKYYVSPDGNDDNDGLTPDTALKTLNSRVFEKDFLKPGDAVLFERGGLWRTGDSELLVPQGVAFGAYGTGEKPRIYGSACDYAKDRVWEEYSPGIWKIKLDHRDAGIVIFDNDSKAGFKQFSFEMLKSNGDYYHDRDAEDFYLFCDSGNPSEVFGSIEIGRRGHILRASDDTVIDNICIKYTGSHGIFASFCRNITVTNCEVGFIGGSEQFRGVRFGNGIEFGMGAVDITVDNCYIYQCYDAAVSFQAWNDSNKPFIDITFSNLLIEYNHYSIEFFDRNTETAVMKNITFSNNVLRFSGHSWAQGQRTKPDELGAHIRVGNRWYKNVDNFVIDNNIFDIGKYPFVLWHWQTEKEQPGMQIYSNSFYSKKLKDKKWEICFGNNNIPAVDSLESLKAAISVFDKAPKEVKLSD